MGEIRDSMQEQYALDDDIADRIEFIYNTKIGGRGNTKDVSITEGELIGLYEWKMIRPS